LLLHPFEERPRVFFNAAKVRRSPAQLVCAKTAAGPTHIEAKARNTAYFGDTYEAVNDGHEFLIRRAKLFCQRIDCSAVSSELGVFAK